MARPPVLCQKGETMTAEVKPAKAKKKGSLKNVLRHWELYAMMLPGLIYLIVNNYIPMAGLVVAFKKYNYKDGIWGSDWAGLSNFKYLFSTRDAALMIRNTLGYNFVFIVTGTVFAIIVAIVLNEIRANLPKKIYQVFILIPYLISMVVVGSIWRILYDPNIGPINQILEAVGLGDLAQAWLSQKNTALPAITITWIWRTIPFNMLILYANIMTMSRDYLEAADIDGASSFQKLRFVILPYLKPTFITLIMLTVTNDLRAFDMVWIMTQGGPGGASEVMTSYVYRTAFQTQKFGTATAASIVMMVVMIAATVGLQVLKRGKGED